jgi:hypothetical protein
MRPVRRIEEGDRFTVTSAATFMLLTKGEHDYFPILRKKLGWGQVLRTDG